MNKPIYVTQPALPPLNELVPYLEQIWENKVLTNCGPFHHLLEKALCDYLGVQHISLFTNATIALVTALQALKISGEVITTPYSFVATSHSLLWNGLTPVFVDIESDSLNLDPKKIEQAITPMTTAILPVHCYGTPCRVNEISEIAKKYRLKIIYDAAHAFGVNDQHGSVLKYGDLSILSFHATKVFNTFEGGAIICPDAQTKTYIDQLRNFGHDGEIKVISVGINGKMSEFNAALGLLQLKYLQHNIEKRAAIDAIYRTKLQNVPGIQCLTRPTAVVGNFSYFPILVNSNFRFTRDELYLKLKGIGVHTRRYFFPLISQFPMYSNLPSSNEKNLPVASTATQQILCLPIYPDLDHDSVHRIIDFITGP